MLELRKKVEKLEGALHAARTQAPAGADKLAQGDEQFEVHCVASRYGNGEHYSDVLSWNGIFQALLKRVWVGAAPISGSARGAGGAGGLGIERSWCSPDPAADGRTSGGSGRSGVAPGRPACQRATRVLRCAAALRVTHRPSRRSDSSYGPCGPAWTGASRPSTTTRPARRPAVGDRCRLIGPTATPGPGAGPGTPVGRGAGPRASSRSAEAVANAGASWSHECAPPRPARRRAPCV